MPYTEAAGARVPIRMWADPQTVEPAAMDQLRNVTRLPWVHGLAVLPDVHYGKGATVGSVVAMRDAVSPAAVGVDIGCGMTAVKSSLTAGDLPENLGRLRSGLEEAIPVGHRSHRSPVDPRRIHGLRTAGWEGFWDRFAEPAPTVRHRRQRAAGQIGTLGGGNHFLEICLDGDGAVWALLHSGSRNIGKELAEYHIEQARGLPHNQDLPDRDLAVFVAGSPEMRAYRRDLFRAQEYARRNRDVLMGLACDVMRGMFPGVCFGEWISCHQDFSVDRRRLSLYAASPEHGEAPGDQPGASLVWAVTR